MDERQFRMKCPKCRSYSFTVRRDQRAYVHKSQPFELVFSCRCGKQLFGEQIQLEYDRQKVNYDQGGDEEPEVPAVDPELAERQREEARRKEQLRRAMEYRRKYLAEKRRQQTEEERNRKDEEDRLLREKVSLVDEPSKKSPTSSAAATSGAMGSRVRTSPPSPAPAPAKPPAAPQAPAANAAPPAPSPSAPTPDLDPEHPHAEFMPYLANGTFASFFPDATPPDVKDPALCIWPPCEKPRRKKSKYCSRECSNKNARWRHKQRKKA